MRRAVLILSIALVLLLGIAFFVVSSSLDRYRPQVQAQIQSKLGRPVVLGHLSLHLLPLSLKVNGFTIQEDPSFKSPKPFATADQVFVSVEFLSLLSGSPNVRSLVLDEPKIELIRSAAGAWNYSSLGTHAGTNSSGSQLVLDQMKINDGQIGYTDAKDKQNRAVYDHIDVEIRHFAPHRPFDLDIGAHLPGKGTELLKFAGKVGPINAQNATLTPLSGHLTLQALTLSALNRFAPGTIPQDDDAIATGEADLSTASQTLACKGDLKLEDAVVHGAKLDFPVSARYNFTADRASEVVNLQSASIGLGQTSFALNGTLNAGSKPIATNLHLVTRNSSIAELGHLAGAFGIASNASYQMKGIVSADITATGPVTQPLFNGSINAKALEISGGEIKQPVQVPEIDLALSPQTVRSNTFNAQSGSTALQAQFALANYSTAARNIDGVVKTSNANIAELLNIAKAYGYDASQGMNGSGKLSLDLHVQGPVSNPSALSFAGTASIAAANFESPLVTQPVAVQSANLQFSQNTVSASNLNASVGSTTVTGSVSARNFATPQVQFALSANKIDTSELQHLQKATPSSHATSNAKSQSMLDRVTGTGTLAAAIIKAQSLVLTDFRANCKLDRGIIQLSPVTSNLFGGKETGTITYNERPVDPVISVNTKFSGVDSNALLSAVSSVKDTLFGNLAAETNLNFTLANSSAEIAKSLNGTLGFNLANGQLKNVNILNEISKVGKFLHSASSQNATETALKRLSGTMDIKSGLASTSNLTAALDAGSLSGTGTVNLVDQSLNMHVDAVLAQGPSQSVGGAGIGGYLNTALANNKGELVIPVIVTGTTAHPLVSPDIQSLAKMKLNNLLPTSGDPSKLTSGIVGAVTGKQGASGLLNQVLGGSGAKPAQPNSKPAHPAQDTVNSILQQFGKKKPKQQ